ncbi:Hypothetical protein SRAE_X000016300 [Strongyloides ratti]|uniref:Uncharacterized protein n=1 Tax=Strongyloides ratti TaxID=34506 RepID=A0A090N0K2_STRRB|nr:Hypothetical protein SRAE_X000016300 [Strongyloides ratti]CEF70833.1 Hypothetical protein SRAE_X000016300 [Strongyloides ratti]
MNNNSNISNSQHIVYNDMSNNVSSTQKIDIKEVQKINFNDSHEVLFKLHWEEKFTMYYSLFTIIFILLFVWIAFTYSQFSQEYYYYKVFKQLKRGQPINI